MQKQRKTKKYFKLKHERDNLTSRCGTLNKKL